MGRKSGLAKLCLSPHIHVCNLGEGPKEGRCSPVENVLEGDVGRNSLILSGLLENGTVVRTLKEARSILGQ